MFDSPGSTQIAHQVRSVSYPGGTHGVVFRLAFDITFRAGRVPSLTLQSRISQQHSPHFPPTLPLRLRSHHLLTLIRELPLYNYQQIITGSIRLHQFTKDCDLPSLHCGTPQSNHHEVQSSERLPTSGRPSCAWGYLLPNFVLFHLGLSGE